MAQIFLPLSCLIAVVLLIGPAHLHPQPKDKKTKEAEAADQDDSDSASSSWENDGNANDRGIGFNGKTGNSKGSGKYLFYVTPEPHYTQSPEMFKRLQAKGYNDIDDVDKDYYAHYDFEFAKSGSNHANFQQKYLKNQASHIGKPLVASNATAPPPEDGLAGAYGTKADTKPTSDTDGLVRGLGIGL